MNITSKDSNYTVGGAVPFDSPTYIKRSADDELYNLLKQREFCYVLNSRQMGKTSLLNRTIERLKSEEFTCVKIDLSGDIGTDLENSQQWYETFIEIVLDRLNLNLEKSSYSYDNNLLSILRRLGKFFENILTAQSQSNIIIFIDEIDTILGLKFRIDDFFSFIRYCYNQRNFKPEYKRLTFVLFGVATPSDLIQDQQVTPFNIGKAIELQRFKLEEAQPLAQGLVGKFKNYQDIFGAILNWTGGQPFLTQKLCHLAVSSLPVDDTDELLWLDNLVYSKIIKNWEYNDNPQHLKTIETQILSKEKKIIALLDLYQQILTNGKIKANNSRLEEIDLILSGLVVKEENNLIIYNPIYKKVFNKEWVETNLENLRSYASELKGWLNSNQQDDSYLLKGNKLEEAKQWAKGKTLGNDDYNFLSASEQLETQRLQRQLEKEREAHQKAENIVKKARNTAKRIGSGIIALLFIATGFGFMILSALREAKEGVRLEKEAKTALVQFESNQIEALLLAMKAGQDLQVLIGDNRPLQSYPSISPLSAIQTIIGNIREQNRLIGHQGAVSGVSYSPNGQYIATAGVDNTIRLWDSSGKQVIKIEEDQGIIRDISFSPNGKNFATSGESGEIILWDLSGHQLAKLKGHKGAVLSISFSSDGQYLASAGMDGKVIIWNSNGKQINKFEAHLGGVWDINFDPTDKKIVTAGEDGVGRLWDLSGNKLTELKGHKDVIRSINFSPNGKQIVTSGDDETVRLWDLSGNQLERFEGHNGSIANVKFINDGKRLFTIGEDGTIRIWDLSGNQLEQLNGHQGKINSMSLSYNRQYIATAGEDGTVRLWNLSSKHLTQFKASQEALWKIYFNVDGYQIATIGLDGKAKLWNWKEEQLASLNTNQGWAVDVLFLSDGKRLLTAGLDGIVRIWNLDGKKLAEYKAHPGGAKYQSISQDGQIIATVQLDGTVAVWNLTGKKIAQLKGQYKWWSARVSQDGKYIATVSEEGIVQLWDSLGNQLALIKNNKNKFSFSYISPDNKHLVTIDIDNNLYLWDFSGKLIKQWKITQEKYQSFWQLLMFSSDSQKIATFEYFAKEIQIWDLLGKQVGRIQLDQPLLSMDFSRDGNRIITGNSQGKVQIWDLSGKQLEQKQIDQGKIFGVGFSPNDHNIGILTNKGQVEIWNLLENKQSSINLQGHQTYVGELKFSPNYQSILTVGDYTNIEKVRLWDLSGKILKDFDPQHIITYDFEISPDGEKIATVGLDDTARIWDTSGKLLAEMKGHKGAIWNVDFSSDGEKIATAGFDGTARIWDISGKQLTQIKSDKISNLAFSSDSKFLLTIGYEDETNNNLIEVWDLSGNPITHIVLDSNVRTFGFTTDTKKIMVVGDNGMVSLWSLSGEKLASFEGHRGTVWSFDIGLNEELLATGGEDGIVRLWLLSGQQIAQFNTGQEGIRHLEFDFDGQILATGGEDGTVKLWYVGGLSNLLDQSCHWLKDYLISHPQTLKELTICQKVLDIKLPESSEKESISTPSFNIPF